MRYVIALGGNALEDGKAEATAERQLEAIKQAVKGIVDVVEAGHTVVITHGNGPQVGRILMQNELAQAHTPAMPFDLCGAMSQGMIGYHIQQALRGELLRRKLSLPVATVVTQVIVDADDPAFSHPTKPIGAFYDAAEAERLTQERGYTMKEDAGRGFRRVVASPQPKTVVELKSIEALIASGQLVIACGGGGVPVVERDGLLHGVPAVIDKDLASALLAQEIGADQLIILTAVEQVAIRFGQENQENLAKLSVADAKKYASAGEFGEGSMLPKVLAGVHFAQSGEGRSTLITSLEALGQAISGIKGTRIDA